MTETTQTDSPARKGGGPQFIECRTYRMGGHAAHDKYESYMPMETLAETPGNVLPFRPAGETKPPPDISRHTKGWGEPPIRDQDLVPGAALEPPHALVDEVDLEVVPAGFGRCRGRARFRVVGQRPRMGLERRCLVRSEPLSPVAPRAGS